MQSPTETKDFHVGLIGAGLGGLATAIALRHAGAQVTVLEAASELGEIGAGIQMTPSVSRLLQKWGVANIIGSNLVRVEELNMRTQDGTKAGYTRMERVEEALGHPWWLVHRAHLHSGLAEVARRNGAELVVGARARSIEHEREDGKVMVVTGDGKWYVFDLCVGSDGVNSVVRKTLFPDVRPEPPTTNCAYRAIVPYEQIRKDPIARELIERMTMDVWMGDQAYIITYPISGGRDLNLVLSHHTPEKTHAVIPDISVEEMRETYKMFDPRIRRVLDMITSVSRWPLLVIGPLPSWRSPSNNVILTGDSAHSMTNHMAQGAATAMEDGTFLAHCVRAYLSDRISLSAALDIYEAERMPKARAKQQVSFLNGAIWQLPVGPEQQARDEAMSGELEGRTLYRSPNLYGDPRIVLGMYGYDVEFHAEMAVARYCEDGSTARWQGGTMEEARKKYMGWFLPDRGAEKARSSKL